MSYVLPSPNLAGSLNVDDSKKERAGLTGVLGESESSDVVRCCFPHPVHTL